MKSTQNSAKTEFRTLALLVAVILVTAVALGIFINTVVFLQEEAEASHDEALSVVDQELAVNDPDESAVGVSDGMDDEGDPVGYELRIEIQRPPDTADLDLTELQIELEGSGGVGTFQHVSTATNDGELDPDGDVDGIQVARDVFFVDPVSVESVDAELTDDGDRYELVVPLGVFVDSEGALRDSPTSDAGVTTPERGYDDADVAVDVPGVLDDGEGLDNSGVGPLEASDIVSVTITTEHGGAETVEFQVSNDLRDVSGGSV